MQRTLFLLATSVLILTGCNNQMNEIKNTKPDDSRLTEVQARTIAENNCIKGGEALGPGTYNEITKTWWFDANLNATKPGCNPACVVSEETKTVEINWRCTGLLQPDANESTEDKIVSDLPEDLNKIIVSLFEDKYPENITSTSVHVTHQTADHARGSVSFAEGMAGGNWLATKINGEWQLVHDGNGVIPCSLKADYGFPDEMLEDCA